MKFELVDRILALEAGRRITAIKALSSAEEYLADHFPTFPVMPGVLMLESLVQASAWLLRVTRDFPHSMVLLKMARNVRYTSFVTPGRTLRVESVIKKCEEQTSQFKAEAFVENEKMVSAQITLMHYNLADRDPEMEATDREIIAGLRRRYALLCGQ